MVPTTWQTKAVVERRLADSIRRLLAAGVSRPERLPSRIGPTRRRLLGSVLPVGGVMLAGCLDRVGSTDNPGEPEEFPVLGWYPGWMREEFPPEDVAFELLDLLYYANFEPAPDGTIEFTGDYDDSNLTDFRDLKQSGEPAEDVLMGFAIGGWNSSVHFSDAARSVESRERFAREAIELMREYDFDGFEIDWEFPTGEGRSENVEREEDVENVVALVEECRDRLEEAMDEDDREYTLSYSGAAYPSHVRPLDVERLSELVDWVNVMAYDLSGPGSPATAHNAPVYGTPSADEAVTIWASEGMDRSQLMVGHAFYGRGFDGVEPGPNDDGFDQPFDEHEASLDYEEIAGRISDSGWEYHWDEYAAAPYLYHAEDGNWVSATDPDYVEAKTTYALEEGCRGVFCWELAFDSDAELLETMYDTVAEYDG